MPTVADRLSPTAREDLPRDSFHVAEAGSGKLGRGSLVLRAVVVAAALLLALAAQLSTREFDAGWMLALVVLAAAVLAVLAMSLLPVGDFLRGLGGRLERMAERRARARADERFLDRAVHDPRLMAELQTAMSRQPAQDAAGQTMRLKVDAAIGAASRARY